MTITTKLSLKILPSSRKNNFNGSIMKENGKAKLMFECITDKVSSLEEKRIE